MPRSRRRAFVSLVLFAVLTVIGRPGRADPFNIDAAKAEKHVAKLREQAQQRADPAALLRKELPEIELKAIPAGDVLDYLRDVTGVLPIVDRRALERAGVALTTPVTIARKNGRFGDVVADVLNATGAARKGLKLEAVDELLVISTPDRLEHVRRLLTPPPAAEKQSAAAARLAEIEACGCTDFCLGLRLSDASLEASLQQISAATRTPIRADWEALRGVGISRDDRLSIRLPNTSVRCVLVALLLDLGPLERVELRETEDAVTVSVRPHIPK